MAFVLNNTPKNYTDIFHTPYNLKYRLTHPATCVKLFFKRVKWIWQRARRGYCDYDVWDIDVFLTNILPPMLRQLSEGISYPGDTTPEKWAKELNEIADKIAHMAKDEIPENPQHGDFEKNYERKVAELEEVCDWMKKNFFSLWD